MPASGTFGPELGAFIDFDRLGALVPKTVTKSPRVGNPTPRVCETPCGMINSIGIQSPGLEAYLKRVLPLYRAYRTPVIASIEADTIDEFAEMAEAVAAEDVVKALELNISCPNLEKDGLAFGMDADTTYRLVRKVKEVTDKPVIAKLTPNVTSIQDIARAAEAGGADALTIANTILAMAIDIHTRRPKIGNVMGGLSGPAIRPIIVRMIYQAYRVVCVPIIGSGGVMSGEDAIEMMLAGATAVQVGTANFVDPTLMLRIIEEIKNYMMEKGYQKVSDLVGKVEV
ncbi:MAG: dihydroorotate dehydrogenase [Hydrogenibacillus schlegelii]|nr:dihydroorotate dehydrogenase [Hydrogenibacillus schlegelii]